MPVAVTIEPVQSVPMSPPRKRWTRAECELLEQSGLFLNEQLELVDGELINKMGKNHPHVYAVASLIEWLVSVFRGKRVSPESPIDVAPEDNPTNEPQPDVIVLNRPMNQLSAGRPKPQDLALVIEASDSTLAFDLSLKAGLYARAGIVEYWVLDINGRRMLVHRDPQAGAYQSIVAYGETEKISPLAAPSAELLVGEVLL
jgi:Uma2 family endonuclease